MSEPVLKGELEIGEPFTGPYPNNGRDNTEWC